MKIRIIAISLCCVALVAGSATLLGMDFFSNLMKPPAPAAAPAQPAQQPATFGAPQTAPQFGQPAQFGAPPAASPFAPAPSPFGVPQQPAQFGAPQPQAQQVAKTQAIGQSVTAGITAFGALGGKAMDMGTEVLKAQEARKTADAQAKLAAQQQDQQARLLSEQRAQEQLSKQKDAELQIQLLRAQTAQAMEIEKAKLEIEKERMKMAQAAEDAKWAREHPAPVPQAPQIYVQPAALPVPQAVVLPTAPAPRVAATPAPQAALVAAPRVAPQALSRPPVQAQPAQQPQAVAKIGTVEVYEVLDDKGAVVGLEDQFGNPITQDPQGNLLDKTGKVIQEE